MMTLPQQLCLKIVLQRIYGRFRTFQLLLVCLYRNNGMYLSKAQGIHCS